RCRGAEVRRRRHRGDMARVQDIGAGARRPCPLRPDVNRDRHVRAEDRLDDLAHRRIEAARRAELDDDESGAFVLGAVAAAHDAIARRRADRVLHAEQQHPAGRLAGATLRRDRRAREHGEQRAGADEPREHRANGGKARKHDKDDSSLGALRPGVRYSLGPMTQRPNPAEWHPASWQRRPAAQQPAYRDAARLESTLSRLADLPPLVTSWEVEALKSELAAAQRGEAFLLQGGDCAESFDECTSENIVQQLKILLQMSLVMLVGLKKPVIRVGRLAGQYAKPRSADLETRNGVSLPSYRGDVINRSGFPAADREPEPELMLRGYERAAPALDFIQSLLDGGFADLHHPENWDLGFVGESALAAEYHELVRQV